ncbi:HAMP domain-containing histidine kinase [Candidatus Dependentiae bacterium]|nr:HAMP domain-containing histidine kinase [Candidatus Dependentiae bacterium]
MKLTFKRKLILILFFILSSLFVVQVLIVNHFTEKYAIEYENNEMKEYMELCIKIYFNELELNNTPQIDIELEHFYFQVRDESDKIIYSSPKIKMMKTEHFTLKNLDKNEYYYNDKLNGDLVRIYVEKQFLNGKIYKFVYFISLNEYLKFVNKINGLFIIIFIIVIVILFLISNFFVNKALNPINRIINDVEKINIKTLSGRIKKVESNDILENLTTTFNYMIERLEISFNRINGYFSNFSHEIKTPISVIKNGVELLQKSKKNNDEESNILYRLSEEIDAVQRMTGELLFLAKADAENIKLNFSTIKLKELISFSEDIGKIMTDEKKIKFIINFPDTENSIYIDEFKIKQVIINLLNNAVEYTNSGEISINFSIEHDYLIISVSDTGIGIDPQNLPYIFERFYRCDKIRSREKHHFGLGLSIVKMIIELHKGSIEIKSIINKGTTATIKIPIANISFIQ